MQLLREISEEVTLEEAKIGDKKHHYISGIFMQAEIKNGNGRIYPFNIMNESVSRYIEAKVAKKTAYGELDHPKNANVSLKNVSHIIESLKADGNNFIGRARIAEETACGKTAIGLIKAGANLGVSSRALGSINETSRAKMVEKMHIITAGDIVADPSAPEAFMNALYENKEWIWDNGVAVEKIVEQVLRPSVDRAARDEMRIKAFGRFMKEMKNG